MIDVLSCGASNFRSVLNALDFLRIPSRVCSTPHDLEHAEALIFPGVGHFGFVSNALQRSGLTSLLKHRIKNGLPYLGICLGMQLLFEVSEEAPGAEGLAIIPGAVERLRHPRVPHIGWNRLSVIRPSPLLLEGEAYFVNSFAPRQVPSAYLMAQTTYGEPFASAVGAGSAVGLQFHPEKSGLLGLRMLKNWCETCVPLL